METERKVKDVRVHDIINGITMAKASAERLAEQRPEVVDVVKRLEEDLMKAQKTFVDAVMPILRPSKGA